MSKLLVSRLCSKSLPVHADEVRSLDDNLVGAIDPTSPGVDVSDLSCHANGADHAPHVVNTVGKNIGVDILPVKILASDRNRNDPVLAVGRNGVEQRLLLGIEVGGVLGPYTDEDLNACVLSGRDGVGKSVAVGTGVEADGRDVLREALQFVEGGGPLSSRLAGAIRVVGTDVEALPVC